MELKTYELAVVYEIKVGGDANDDVLSSGCGDVRVDDTTVIYKPFCEVVSRMQVLALYVEEMGKPYVWFRVVPDSPSKRMMSIPITRKLALKCKLVFGTGDYWRAPTATDNMAFVRAVSQAGMSLCIIEHGPRALTGD